MQTVCTVQKWQVRGKTCWAVYRLEDGKRRRSFFSSRTAAEAEASRLNSGAADLQADFRALPIAEQQKLIHLHNEAARRGVDVLDFLSAPTSNGAGPTVEAVISELLEAKRNAGRSDRYVDSLDLLLSQFLDGREHLRIGNVSLADIERFLDSKAIASRSTLRARLSTLFRFAVRRGYRLDNPCSRLEPIKLVKTPPRIFTVGEFEKAMSWLKTNRPDGLPWFVLSTCCGLRPEEADQTRRRDINFKEGWIKVEAQTSKVGQRRVIEPMDAAIGLLKRVCRVGRLPIPRNTRRRIVRLLRDGLCWDKWPKDITRHTAASYWLAVSRSAGDVAENLGNSEAVLKRHYKALVTRAEAEEFWKAVNRASASPSVPAP